MSRWKSACVALLIATFAPWGSPPRSAAVATPASRPITGVARDALGNVLEGVEVLILGELPGGLPLAVSRTDDEGRFAIGHLAPGIYRVAAIKRGYRAYIAHINTMLQASVDMLLQPMPALAGDAATPVPDDAEWVLRVPRRSLLRDIERESLLTTTSVERAPPLRPLWEALQLEVDQTFVLGQALPGSGGDASAMEGASTRLRLGGTLGERVRLTAEGARERLRGAAPGEPSRVETRRRFDSLRVGLSYDTPLDSRLALGAFFSRRELARESFARERDGQRSFGYDASWSRRLDADSRLTVQLDYRDTRLDDPSARLAGGAAGADSSPGGRRVSDRSFGAQGVYESAPAPQHAVKLGFRARFAEPAPLALRPVDPTFAWDPGFGGWSFRLNAEDHWSATVPLTLIYGLGYERIAGDRGRSLLVPRVGGSWSAERLALRVLLSYHAGLPGGGPGAEDDGVPATSGGVGYEAELEVPVLDSLRLRGALAYDPVEYRPRLHDPGPVEPAFGAAPYVSDGDTSSRRATVALTHVSEWTRASLELTRGMAEGTLAALPSIPAPLERLSAATLDYRNGSLGLRVLPSGTDMALEYRRVEELPAGLQPLDAAFVERSLEFRLLQDLMLMPVSGSWRLLLAIQVASRHTADGAQPPATFDEPPLASTRHRLSAGVSVAF